MSLIPVNNKPALIGYYLGFAALIPCIGCIPAIAAIILGFIGLSKAGQLNGEGRTHAIVALVLGFGSFFLWSALNIIFTIASANN